MNVLAQIDQASTVVNRAVTESGWMAGLVVLIVLGALGLFGFMIRGDRSELREINRFVRTELPDVIDGNLIIISRFIAVLNNRPCLHDSDMERLGTIDPKRMSEDELAELDGVAKRAADRIRRREVRRARMSTDDGGSSNG